MLDKTGVLVVMPFSKTTEAHTAQYWARHFNSYLKPLIAKVESTEAVLCEPLTDNSAQQIILDLVKTSIIVADITDNDPRVLWELGVRQSYKQATIVIAEIGTQLPFKFSEKGVLLYNGDYLDNQTFEEKFKETLQNCINNPDAPESPVLETLGGRSTLYGIIHEEENSRRIDGLLLELNVNDTLLGQIFENCVRNKALRAANKSEAKKMTTTPLKTAAIEFLLTNRYLDKDKTFYATVYACHNFLEAINNHLIEWESTSSDKEAEDWLLACKDAAYKNLAKLREHLRQN
jgi:uncharacterized lipoprotein YehR (DUF1307 family)